jgi:hypothetical protein
VNAILIALVNSSAMPGERFKTGAVIPDSGIYRVTHSAHRLPHEVTLLKGETFPKCQKCAEAVTFQMIRVVKYTKDIRELSWHVVLYELPVLAEDIPPLPNG